MRSAPVAAAVSILRPLHGLSDLGECLVGRQTLLVQLPLGRIERHLCLELVNDLFTLIGEQREVAADSSGGHAELLGERRGRDGPRGGDEPENALARGLVRCHPESPSLVDLVAVMTTVAHYACARPSD